MSSEARAEVRAPGGDVVEVGAGVEGVLLAELTDEELSLLDGLEPEERLVVLPWLDSLPAEQRELAMLVAFRSLVARGLATAPDAAALEHALQEPQPDGRTTVQVTVEELLAALLAGRAAAHRVVSCQRVHRERQDFLYLFESEDDGEPVLLGELVGGTGLHRFFRVDDRDTVRVLQSYLEPEPWGQEVLPDLVVDHTVAAQGAAAPELVAQLDAHDLHAQVLVLSAGPSRAPVLHGVFAGARGVRTTSVRAGSQEPVVFRSRAGGDLRRWLTEEVLA